MQTKQQGGHEDILINLNIKEKLPLMLADPGAITHILNNLIGNAIKYSKEKPHITVTVHTENNEMIIAVEDRGIGIPKNETEKIFDRFYRVGDELTRKVKGSGLGLALVKELVLAHGGTVTANSEIDKGSTFTVSLPLNLDKEKNNG